MSHQVGPAGPGSGVDHAFIFDSVRGQSYDVLAPTELNPNLRPESAVTQTAGVIFQRGEVHRFRAAVDFVDTRKVNELVFLDPSAVMDLEAQLPGRVDRAPLAPGDTHSAGYVTSVLTGTVNMAWRHSQNWNTSLDYAWTQCAGGTLELYGRLVWFQRFDRQVFSDSPEVDELRRPDGAVSGLLRARANFGAGWNNRRFGFGLDGHYFDMRKLPERDWPGQGGDRIDSCWQVDAYLQSELGRWLPWKSSRVGLLAQLRVNNLFGPDFPKYAADPSGAGVQAYGDWRGRTYSVSLTASF
jgi:outer membrane receptor protein involved in Fe transport